jgi:lysozyme family protein
MQPFTVLRAEYEGLIAQAKIRPECKQAFDQTGRRLLRDKDIYLELAAKTSVPAAMLMALSEREMSGNLHCYLGNGQSLKWRTTIVPIGRGPFPQQFHADFIAGGVDSLHLDQLDQVASKIGWMMSTAAYESEEWNGTGYRRPPDGGPPIPSPYWCGGTTIQKPGKFIRDHVFARVMDPQLGTIPIIETLIEMDPSLAFDSGAPIPKVDDAPSITPQPHPAIGETNIIWVQRGFNALQLSGTPLLVDGNPGRGTRTVTRQFEIDHHLTVDRGYPGPEVAGALADILKAKGIEIPAS